MMRYGWARGALPLALALVVVLAGSFRAGGAQQGAAVIAGRVTDAAGAPVPATLVRAVQAGAANAGPDRRGGDYTGTDGRYEIRELRPGTYWVYVEASHVTHATDTVPSLMVPPSLRRERPEPRFTSEDGGFYWPVPAIAPGVPPPPRPDGRDAVFITTAHPSDADIRSSTPVSVDAGQVRTGIDIRMRAVPRVSVRGRVVVPGVTDAASWRPVLRLRGEDAAAVNDPWRGAAFAYARLDGSFEFLSAPPGDWTLEVFRMLDGSDVARNDPFGMTAQRPLSIGEQGIDGLEIRLEPGATVRARLEFDGPPPANDPRFLFMRLNNLSRSLGNGDWQTTPGAFVATGVAPGTYSFYSRIAGWHLASVTQNGRDITGRAFEVARDDVDDLVVSFSRHPTEIVGVVQGLAPSDVADTRVVLFPADPDEFAAASFERVEVSDVGAFAFGDVVPGTYFIAAVPVAALDDWPVRSALVALSQRARLVTARAGEMAMIDLERAHQWP